MKKVFFCVFTLFLFACTTATQPSTSPFDTASSPLTETSLPAPVAPEKATGIPTYTPFPSLTPEPRETKVSIVGTTLLLPTLEAGRSIELSSIQMMDAQTGWGLYLGASEVLRSQFQGPSWRREGYILRTTDGGNTWQNVTPPAGVYSTGGFFALDADTAWANSNVPCCMGNDTTQLWRTQDGGRNWQASEPFSIKIKDETSSEFYVPLQIQFIDPDTGWLLSSSRAGMGDRLRAILLNSTDGGDTWTDMEFGVNGFMGNCWNGGLAFINPTTGWYGTSCVGSPRVFRFNEMFGEGGWKLLKTTDGGNSFTASTLIPTPPDLQELSTTNPEVDCGEKRVVAFTSKVLGIEWECRDYGTYKDYHYFSLSADAGNAWRTWTTSGNEYFIDAAHGWRLMFPGQLQRLTNDGLNWTTIKTVTWDNAQFNFINELEGWAIVSNGNVSALVHTTDGGLSWSEIKPILGP